MTVIKGGIAPSVYSVDSSHSIDDLATGIGGCKCYVDIIKGNIEAVRITLIAISRIYKLI